MCVCLGFGSGWRVVCLPVARLVPPTQTQAHKHPSKHQQTPPKPKPAPSPPAPSATFTSPPTPPRPPPPTTLSSLTKSSPVRARLFWCVGVGWVFTPVELNQQHSCLTPQHPTPHQQITPLTTQQLQAPAIARLGCTSPASRASRPTSSRRRTRGWRCCRYVAGWMNGLCV